MNKYSHFSKIDDTRKKIRVRRKAINCLRKKKFPSNDAAKEAIIGYSNEFNILYRSYYCKSCRNYHVSTRRDIRVPHYSLLFLGDLALSTPEKVRWRKFVCKNRDTISSTNGERWLSHYITDYYYEGLELGKHQLANEWISLSKKELLAVARSKVKRNMIGPSFHQMSYKLPYGNMSISTLNSEAHEIFSLAYNRGLNDSYVYMVNKLRKCLGREGYYEL